MRTRSKGQCYYFDYRALLSLTALGMLKDFYSEKRGIWYNMVWYDGMVCKYGLKTHTIPNTIPSYHTKIIINPYLELIKPLNQKRSPQEMKGQPYLSVRH